MYIRQRDVLVGAVLVLYIVFFALSPPAAVRTVLSHPVGVAASFGVAVYTALYHSKPIGALLIVALLASMTRVTEHLTDAEKSTIQKQLDDVNKTISDLQGMGLRPESNDALKNALAQRTTLQAQLNPAPASTPSTPPPATPPMTTPTAPALSSPGPAVPPAATPSAPSAPAKPVMACNIENFAPF